MSGHSDATAALRLEKKSVGALGGWLTRLTGAYSVAGEEALQGVQHIMCEDMAWQCTAILAISCSLLSMRRFMYKSIHCAVRGLGGSLLVRGDRMNDFAETRDRLERTAAGGLLPKTLWSAVIVCTLNETVFMHYSASTSSKQAHLAEGIRHV